MQENPLHNANRKEATVLSVNPDDDDGVILGLSSGERLENDHTVMRIKTLKNGSLVSHPGVIRSIGSFNIVNQTDFRSPFHVMKRATTSRLHHSLKKAISKSPGPLKALVQDALSVNPAVTPRNNNRKIAVLKPTKINNRKRVTEKSNKKQKITSKRVPSKLKKRKKTDPKLTQSIKKNLM